MNKYKIKVKVEFEHIVEIEAESMELAKANAENETMDYLESTCSNSRSFDKFWEYQAVVKTISDE